jgi:hypothetical protein
MQRQISHREWIVVEFQRVNSALGKFSTNPKPESSFEVVNMNIIHFADARKRPNCEKRQASASPHAVCAPLAQRFPLRVRETKLVQSSR